MNYSSKMKIFHYVSPWVLQTLIWVPTRILLRVFFVYKVKGLKNLSALKNDGTGVIFAVNHSSELDPILIPASLSFLSRFMPMFYVAREKSFYKNSGWRQNFYGGLFFRMWGAHTAYAGMNDYDIALRYHIKILNAGRSLCIFPEGKKTTDGNVGDGKPGIGFLIHRTNASIVPVRVVGLYKDHKRKDFLGRTRLKVVFGKPMLAKDFYNGKKDIGIEDYREATKIIMDGIRSLD